MIRVVANAAVAAALLALHSQWLGIGHIAKQKKKKAASGRSAHTDYLSINSIPILWPIGVFICAHCLVWPAYQMRSSMCRCRMYRVVSLSYRVCVCVCGCTCTYQMAYMLQNVHSHLANQQVGKTLHRDQYRKSHQNLISLHIKFIKLFVRPTAQPVSETTIIRPAIRPFEKLWWLLWYVVQCSWPDTRPTYQMHV